MGEGVHAEWGWSHEFGQEGVGEWQFGAGGGHPPDAVLDRFRGDEVAAGHDFDGGGRFSAEADPVQHRFGAAPFNGPRTRQVSWETSSWMVNPGSGVPFRSRVRCPMKAWQACTSSAVSCG